MSLKLMVYFVRRKLINDRKQRMKEEKGKQAEAGEMEERRGKTRKLLSTKGGHRCAEQKACIGFSRVYTCMTIHTHTYTHARTQRYLRDLTQVQMLHSDLLDSPSHVNIQERREGERVRRMGNNLERGSDREKVFSMAVVKEREKDRELCRR